MPAQEQGLLLITSSNDDDEKIACSVVLPRNFRDRCPANSLEVLSEERSKEVEGICKEPWGYIRVQGPYKGVVGVDVEGYGDIWENKNDTRE